MKKILKEKELNSHHMYMLSVFIATFIFQFLKLCNTINISLISDNIGQLAIAAELANLDWQNAIAEASYYGWGYNFIFSLLFKLSSDPYFIYYAIRIFNILIISFISVLIYYFSEKILNANNKTFSLMVSVFIAIQASIEWSTECSVFIIVWIINILLAYLYSLERKSKKSFFLSMTLGISLCYAITLHERNMTLLFSVIIIYLFCFIFNKTRAFDFVPFIGSMIVFFPIEQTLKNLIINSFWPIKDEVIKNVTVFNGDQLWFINDLFDGIKVMIGVIVSNLYTLTNITYGLVVIGILLLLQMLYICFKNKFCLKQRTNMSANEFCFLYSFIATAIIILGLSVQWGRGIAIQNFYSYKGLTYYRYYAVYFWPAVLVICNKLLKNEKVNQFGALVIYGFFSIVFIGIIKDKILFAQGLESRDLKLNNAWIRAFSNSEYNEVLSFIIILILIVVLCSKLKYKLQLFLAFVLVLTILGNNNSMLPTIPALTCDSAGSIYELYSSMSNNDLPKEIYSASQNYTLQYMLNRYTVVYDISKLPNNEHIIFDKDYAENKYGIGYKCYRLDENEYIYVYGDGLINTFDKKLDSSGEVK